MSVILCLICSYSYKVVSLYLGLFCISYNTYKVYRDSLTSLTMKTYNISLLEYNNGIIQNIVFDLHRNICTFHRSLLFSFHFPLKLTLESRY